MENKQIEEMQNKIEKVEQNFYNFCSSVECRSCKYSTKFNSISECKVYFMAEELTKQYRKEIQGHWFIREYEFFTCSECGHDYWNSCDCTKEAKERLADGDTPNYCPNCGAHMTKGAKYE